MAGESLLIAAFSGRALAESARRAGLRPLVVDCFGDEDMRAAAERSIALPARVQVGFKSGPLIAALDALAAEAPTPLLGLVLGSGFECNPRLIERLAARFPLVGNPADVVRHAKSPAHFFAALDRLGIRHPETRLDPPADHRDWLMKRVGGSGGLHIHACPAKARPDKRRYFQKTISGDEVSVMGVLGPGGAAFALTQQWTSPLPRRPYRYGGAIGPLSLDPDLEARLLGIANDVGRELGLVGLVSFDFLVDDGEALLIEVNPRPGATLDVLDDGSGSLLAAHIEAARGGDSATFLAERWQPPGLRAAAILYADRGPLRVGTVPWPDWARDRPASGTEVGRYQPLATVVAEGTTPEKVFALCRERVGELENMMYEGAK